VAKGRNKQKRQQAKPEASAPTSAPSSQGSPQGGQVISKELASDTGRTALLEQLEQQRRSRLLTYLTLPRPDLGTQMNVDVLPILHEHLEKMGHQQRIDLFLYTRGGFTPAPARIAFLLREYCDEFCLLIPRYAHSSGTTLATAADEIVMHRMAELGPIDPSVANAFNPVDPNDPGKKRRIPISVEDVSAYFNLAKSHGQIAGEAMSEPLRQLAEEIHPLALGNVYRQLSLIRTVARRLLATHMDEDKEADRIDAIIRRLTEEFYFHEYPISRIEARDYVGMKIKFPELEVEETIWALCSQYDATLGLEQPAVPPNLTVARGGGRVIVDSAVIESTEALHTYRFEGSVQPGKQPGEVDVQARGTWGRR